LHPDLCLLLSTSGSAGSPRMVRLSRRAVQANAGAIAQALALGGEDRVATTLPLSYSYGLSLLHSHLAAGAAVVLSDLSVLSRPFWDLAASCRLTSLAGVPFLWQSLRRLNLAALAPPSVRFGTQAGGRLDRRLTLHFHDIFSRRGGGMITMYGQTEATARMTVLSPDQLPARAGSVGRAIPGGMIAIENGVVVYRGANVMMGYACDRADLALADQMNGVLPTGDLGHVDEDGYLWLDGRAGRVVKVVGLRLDLDEVQARAAILGPTAALVRGDDLVMLIAGAVPMAETRAAFAVDLGVPAAAIRWRSVAAIPLGRNGKVDVAAAEALL
jgi:acyl-coenzyme A synthetase/AMP-(fatty) acid ligase